MKDKIKKPLKKMLFFIRVFMENFYNLKKISLFIKVLPYTMVGYKRLLNVYDLSILIEKNKIKGAFVECGVWKGGCAAVMASVAARAKSGRKIWLLDSFEGLPEPSEKDGPIAKDYAQNRAGGKLKTINKCVGPLEDVKKLFFDILKLNKENIVIKKGWFQNTLLAAKGEIGPIAILRLDGDWYESTKYCLDNLYDNVIEKGYVILDDYGHWEGARKALDEFLVENKIKPDIIKIDYTGVYFKKP